MDSTVKPRASTDSLKPINNYAISDDEEEDEYRTKSADIDGGEIQKNNEENSNKKPDPTDGEKHMINMDKMNNTETTDS